MLSSLVIHLALSAHLVISGGAGDRWTEQGVRAIDLIDPVEETGAMLPTLLAQPTPPAMGLARATDRARRGVARLQSQRRGVIGQKQKLASRYEAELRELDKLKRSRASWRRDRQIRAQKASSQALAVQLAQLDSELRVVDAQLALQRQTLLDAIGRELAAQPSAERKTLLARVEREVRRVLRPKARKILVPDDTLDRLADPDELAEQILLIKQAEAELRREREVLERREQRYARMATLREQRDRASQMSALDGSDVRRSTGRVGSGRATNGDSAGAGGGLGSDEGSAPTEPESDFDDGAGFEQSSVVLADVIDPGTADALRQAGRSQSPRTRAKAAARAGKEVDARLRKLSRSRLLIEQHLRKLKSP